MLIYLFIYLYLYYILLFIFLYIYLFLFPEYKGLYSEGLYRKSPSNVAVKKLKNDICTLGEWWFYWLLHILDIFFRYFNSNVASFAR